MASRTGITWRRGQAPEDLAAAVQAYGDRVQAAVLALAQGLAQMMQDEMRSQAPWTDRTGNARGGLFCQAEAAASDLVTIYLSHGHSVEYGVWLELANGGRYQVIMPTIENNLGEINRQLRNLLR